jgi:hypothetical protein
LGNSVLVPGTAKRHAKAEGHAALSEISAVQFYRSMMRLSPPKLGDSTKLYRFRFEYGQSRQEASPLLEMLITRSDIVA